MTQPVIRLYRGESRAHDDLHRDGRPIFFTDELSEALGYGTWIIEADILTERLFEPSFLVYRTDNKWMPGRKPDESLDVSQALLGYLQTKLDGEQAEGLYYDIEGGSWSAVEHPEVQQWLRSAGYEGFVCWEGDGMTYAVFNPDHITIISRTHHAKSSDPTP